VRAATPTQAAQLAVPDRTVLQHQLTGITRQLTRAMAKNLSQRAETLDRLMMRKIWRDPRELLEKRHRNLQSLNQCLARVVQKSLETRQHGLAMAAASLDNLSPLKVMARGYAIISQQERIIKSIDELDIGAAITARLSDGKLLLEVKTKEKI
ncbi:MAG TPA: exodeoxyribonuclease VII large subunit, partial [Syntrophomonas sp.]|nr:exodeoxyribonuclease VII large subunit [Syntrophomonas sp.]